MDKLKNKKKDVISLEGSKSRDAENKSNIENKSTQECKEEKSVILIEEKKETNNINNLSDSWDIEKVSQNIPNIKDSENNNNLIKKITFKIQLLLSMTNKVDHKLATIFSKLISDEQLKCVLEERDSRGICGNLSCGNKLQKLWKRESDYNFSSKDFSLETVYEFFCNERCYQKFKDVLIITKNFDYLRLLNVETLCLLSLLKDFFSDNSYLNEISEYSNNILSKQNIQSDLLTSWKEKFTSLLNSTELNK